jgi:hypothetical protein
VADDVSVRQGPPHRPGNGLATRLVVALGPLEAGEGRRDRVDHVEPARIETAALAPVGHGEQRLHDVANVRRERQVPVDEGVAYPHGGLADEAVKEHQGLGGHPRPWRANAQADVAIERDVGRGGRVEAQNALGAGKGQ